MQHLLGTDLGELDTDLLTTITSNQPPFAAPSLEANLHHALLKSNPSHKPADTQALLLELEQHRIINGNRIQKPHLTRDDLSPDWQIYRDTIEQCLYETILQKRLHNNTLEMTDLYHYLVDIQTYIDSKNPRDLDRLLQDHIHHPQEIEALLAICRLDTELLNTIKKEQGNTDKNILKSMATLKQLDHLSQQPDRLGRIAETHKQFLKTHNLSRYLKQLSILTDPKGTPQQLQEVA